MKGTARALTNIKPMAGGVAVAQLPVGGWVFGDKGATDLTGFTHFYRADGTLVELGKLCKCTLSNLTLTNENEGTTPDPTPIGEDAHIEIEIIGGVVESVTVNEATYRKQ